MGHQISKTARQAMNAGDGVKRMVAVGWVYKHKPGKLQTKPYLTFFKAGEAAKWVADEGTGTFYNVGS